MYSHKKTRLSVWWAHRAKSKMDNSADVDFQEGMRFTTKNDG